MQPYARIKSLTAPGRDELHSTFIRMAELLADSGESGELQFRIVGDEHRHWAVTLGKTQAADARKVEHPALEIVTRTQTWWSIAAGTMSPLQALVEGKLRVRGDMELGERLMRHLAATPGLTSICEVR